MPRAVLLGFLWVLSLVLAGYVGLRIGISQGQPDATTDTMPGIPGHQPAAQPPPTVEPAPDRLQELNALEASNQLFAAIDLANQLLDIEPDNYALRFRLAALYRETQQPMPAISQLLTIRALSLNSDELAQARRAIDLITAETDQSFDQRNAVAEAIRFFEDVLVQEPSHDRHRMYLIRWLIRAEDLATAQRVLDETGLAGITQTELDSLQTLVTQRSNQLPVRRQGGAMFTDVYVTTDANVHRLTMLLDTGATLTAISLQKLRAIGARRTPHSVHAQTANGTVELPIYHLMELQAGPLTLNNVNVAALNEGLTQADGLLGLDILDQMPTPLLDQN